MIDFKFSHQETAEIQKAKDQVSYLARDNFSPSENKPWFLTIFLQKTPIGVSSFLEIDPETWEIISITVREDCRHKKVGSYTLKFIETKIKELGGRWTIVFIPLQMKDFFSKNGYHVSNNGEFIEKDGDMYLKMAKFLYPKTYRSRTRH